MSIQFNQVPNGSLAPFQFIEFDNSRAAVGQGSQLYKTLVIGQRLAVSQKTDKELVRVTGADQADQFWGASSNLAQMLKAYFKNNVTTETWAIGINDLGAGVQATGSITFNGTALDGTAHIYIAGRLIQVGFAAGDDGVAQAAKVQAAIAAELGLPVTAAVGTPTTDVDLTAIHKGEVGNEIDIRIGYNGEDFPSSALPDVSAMSGGTGNPDIDDIIAVLGSETYNVIVCPWLDATNLGKLDTELELRWGPQTQNDGHAILSKDDTHGALGTFGDGLNSKHLTVVGVKGSPTPSYERAAAVAGIVAFEGQLDPARPMQTLEIKGVLAPKVTDRFTMTERDLLLKDGVATVKEDSFGKVKIERLVTTYKKNSADAPDASYRDIQTKLTLSRLRYDIRSLFATKYARHKLAADGTNFGTGQAVITPKVAKSEIVNLFQKWETEGLVEGFEQFKNDLIVEINGDDSNRLDARLGPNLMNQLRVAGIQIQFLI